MIVNRIFSRLNVNFRYLIHFIHFCFVCTQSALTVSMLAVATAAFYTNARDRYVDRKKHTVPCMLNDEKKKKKRKNVKDMYMYYRHQTVYWL